MLFICLLGEVHHDINLVLIKAENFTNFHRFVSYCWWDGFVSFRGCIKTYLQQFYFGWIYDWHFLEGKKRRYFWNFSSEQMRTEHARDVTELPRSVWLTATSKMHSFLILNGIYLKRSLIHSSLFSASIKTNLISRWTPPLRDHFKGSTCTMTPEYPNIF